MSTTKCNAKEELMHTYTPLEMKYIYNGGCESGCAHSHIYYYQTIKFFDKYYESCIQPYIEDVLDQKEIVNTFEEAECDLNTFKNNIVWCYINSIAYDLVCQYGLDSMDDDAILEKQMELTK